MNRFSAAGTIFALTTGLALAQPAPTTLPSPAPGPQLTLDQQLDPIVADITAKVYQLRDVIRQGSEQNIQLKNSLIAANTQASTTTRERDDLKKELADVKAKNVSAPPAEVPK